MGKHLLSEQYSIFILKLKINTKLFYSQNKFY